MLLGDPYFRDVLLQSVQLTIPRDICLPVQIDKIELFRNPDSDVGKRVVTVVLQNKEDNEYISEVVATDEEGYVVERLSGYRLRILEEHPENPTAIELANPEERDRNHLQEVLNTTFKKFGLNQPAVALGLAPNLQAKPKNQRSKQERPIIARALKQKLRLAPQEKIDFRVKSLPSGKPQLTGTSTAGLDLSLSHCDRYCLCVVDETAQGCDIESITHRTVEDWVALLRSKRSGLMNQLVQGGDTQDRAGTRIWSAIEAVRKAFDGEASDLEIVAQQGDSVLLKTQTITGDYLVVTVAVKLTRPPERMVAIVVPQPQSLEMDETKVEAGCDRHWTRYSNDGPQGQLVYEQRFQASFKESGSISRRVYFSQYFRWIGKIRELPMESIASQMLSDFLTGDWGMVTNAVSLRVLGEATAYDIIQARAWVGNVVGSSFDTYIEFCKVLPDNGLERLAITEVKATWVRLVSDGVPSPMPFPTYLQDYLERFAAKQPAALNLKQPSVLPLPPLPASLSQLDSGSIVYQTPVESNRYGRFLRSEVFQTTLEESNLVGNVYYGNYFIWQGRILDLFLYSVAPEYLRVSNPCGEMVCLYSRMDYLREAMPFDKIRAHLYVQSVSECGALFNFEFFREVGNNGSNRKIKVVGLFKLGTSFGSDGNLLTSHLNFLRIFSNRNKMFIDIGLIKLKSGTDVQLFKNKLKAYLPKDVKVLTKQELIEFEKNYWQTSTAIGFIFNLGVFLGIVVGIVVVYQILYSNVAEHLPEYATLKAMGYRHIYLLSMVLQQALFIAILGYIPGLIISVIQYEFTKQATLLPITMTVNRAVFVAVFVLVATIIMCFISGGTAIAKLRAADPADIF